MHPEPNEDTIYKPAYKEDSILVDDRLFDEVLELFTRLNIYGTDFERAEVRKAWFGM